MLALGLALVGAFESRTPRLLAFALWIALLLTQAWTFLGFHYPLYREAGNGGGLAEVLRAVLQPNESIIVAGDDWSSILPYYAQRRALMIRSDQLENPTYLRAAFAAMQDEPVGALVLFEKQQGNQLLRQLAQESFGLNPEPLLAYHDRDRDAVVYLNRQIQSDALTIIHRTGGYYGIKVLESSVSAGKPAGRAGRGIQQADGASPASVPHHHTPARAVFFHFGPELWDEDKPGQERFAAHPDTKLWFQLPAGRHQLQTTLQLIPGAYEGVPRSDASDGVELVAAAVHPDGRREILQKRYINPRDNPADRGPQAIAWSFELPAGTELELSVNAGPQGNGARDWAALSAIVIK